MMRGADYDERMREPLSEVFVISQPDLIAGAREYAFPQQQLAKRAVLLSA